MSTKIQHKPKKYFHAKGPKLRTDIRLSSLEVIGIRPLAPLQNSVSLKLMQSKTLNFVINLPDVKNLTNCLDSILTKVSIIKRFYTLESILGVQSQICSILNIVKLREN